MKRTKNIVRILEQIKQLVRLKLNLIAEPMTETEQEISKKQQFQKEIDLYNLHQDLDYIIKDIKKENINLDTKL